MWQSLTPRGLPKAGASFIHPWMFWSAFHAMLPAAHGPCRLLFCWAILCQWPPLLTQWWPWGGIQLIPQPFCPEHKIALLWLLTAHLKPGVGWGQKKGDTPQRIAQNYCRDLRSDPPGVPIWQQEWLYNLWVSAQNKNMGFLVQKLILSRWWQQSIKTITEPFQM